MMNNVQEAERIVSIDILRGFSILGIFLVNMPAFHTPMLYINPLSWWDKNPDRILYILTDIFAQASFYPLFSFLFGFGAILLAERINQRGQSFPLLFSRRMLALLLFGCIHAFLIWHGDILINYALFGFIFILFYKLSGKLLLILGALIYLIPFLMLAMLTIAAQTFGMDGLEIPTDQEAVRQSLEVYQNGTFIEIMYQRFNDWYSVNNLVSAIILFLSIFPLFLLGTGFAKLRLLERPDVYRTHLRIIMAVSLVLGLLFKLIPYLTANNYATVFLQDTFGGPMLSLFYITAITLLLQRNLIYKVMLPFSYIGRLSMSNYLFQSIIGTLIFYSYGLSFYGRVSFTTGLVLVGGIFVIQILASKYWLKYFLMGPIEYVWRVFTYWRKPSIRRIKHGKGGQH
ncbi:DUF418 domain-containing protein [Bacillus sp. CECT 9360]|uniref:DUF418 domain-containing protein n=1 Tax=Bacillus sp. CECT 9360 TaxID=2845821 RepID=UPI001E5E44DC|nr:DUF418 domain-containing protein [Bacillus sp. CECT 9360]CAH0344433.1 hypothetical protein BCI9360_00688 [Bacillus sp. CECT 9360]